MATSPQPEIMDDPYVGPQPFEERHQAIFFGRPREINDLYSLVVAHGEVLLYAQSGAGKTSLLNAGLIPRLKMKSFVVPCPVRIAGRLPTGIKPEDIANLYMFNALRTWADCQIESKALAAQSLSDFLGLPQKAVESLDSLEGEPAEARSHKDPGNRREAPQTKHRTPHAVLIFDQLEEIFEYYPERRNDRKEFFQQIGEALARDAHLRVVFAIREDYLAQLIPYLLLVPEGMRTRFRLERLRESNALAAIKGPLELVRPKRTFATGAAETLVQELLKIRVVDAEGKQVEVPGDYVEPVQLQVVCDSLWRSLPRDVQEITESHLKAFGDVNEALSRFYEDCLRDAVAKVARLKEGELRKWFGEVLITPAGTRASVYRGPERTGELPNAGVDLLEDLHIIRKEQRAGAAWYELTHDRFIAPIQKSNQDWLVRKGSAHQIKLQLERQAQDWVSSGRAKTKLLDDVQLAEAERWLESPDAAELGYSSNLAALVNQSRPEQKQQETEREKQRADEQRQLATAQRLLAHQAQVMAQELRQRAETERQRAEQQYQLAEAQRSLAQQAQVLAEEQRQRAEEKARSVRHMRLLAAGLAVAAVSAALAALYAYRQRKLAESREVAAVAVESVNADPERAVLLALQALSLRDSAEAEDALHHAVENLRVKLTLYGHKDYVNGVAFSPDGSRVATASGDNTARVWDARSGEQLLSLSGHDAAVWCVTFSPDGKRLATASVDKTAKVWDVESGRELLTLSGHADQVRAVAFSPNGSRIATASADHTAKVWDAESGNLLQTLQSHRDQVWAVAFSPDGKRIATASWDKTAKVWDAESGNCLKTLWGHDDEVLAVAFGPDGKRIVTGSADRTAKVWNLTATSMKNRVGLDADSSDVMVTLSGHANKVMDVAFDYKDRIATASLDGTAKIWDASSGNLLQTLSGHADAVRGVAFCPYGDRIATASQDHTAKVWDITSSGGELLTAIHHRGQAVEGVAFSPDGKRLATADSDSTAKIWDVASGMELRTLAGHKGPIHDLAFSPDGKRLATASKDKTAKVWDVASGKELVTISGHTGDVLRVTFSPDGKNLATASEDGSAKVWDASSGGELRTHDDRERKIVGLAFSMDGKYLAAASWHATAPGTAPESYVTVWDAKSGQELRSIRLDHNDRVSDVAFSPDSRRLATASWDNTAKVWDWESGKELLTLSGHTQPLTGIAFIPDGSRLVTSSWDASARLWDLSRDPRDAELLALTWPETPFLRVALSPDGRHLAAAGWDGVARVYALNVTDLVALARKAVTRSLRAEECQKDLHRSSCPSTASALEVFEQGAHRARVGDLSGAAEAFHKARKSNVVLDFDPDAEARDLRASMLVETARNLAAAGDSDAARKSLQKALELNPSLALEPDQEAILLAAQGQVEHGTRLVRQGRIQEAIRDYEEVRRIDAASVTPESWNSLCWYGALWGYATEVMFACEQAVALEPDNGNIRDSRGVARVLTGHKKEAIDDFMSFVQSTAPPRMRSQRMLWVMSLRAGKNPLTPKEIEALLTQ